MGIRHLKGIESHFNRVMSSRCSPRRTSHGSMARTEENFFLPFLKKTIKNMHAASERTGAMHLHDIISDYNHGEGFG